MIIEQVFRKYERLLGPRIFGLPPDGNPEYDDPRLVELVETGCDLPHNVCSDPDDPNPPDPQGLFRKCCLDLASLALEDPTKCLLFVPKGRLRELRKDLYRMVWGDYSNWTDCVPFYMVDDQSDDCSDMYFRVKRALLILQGWEFDCPVKLYEIVDRTCFDRKFHACTKEELRVSTIKQKYLSEYGDPSCPPSLIQICDSVDGRDGNNIRLLSASKDVMGDSIAAENPNAQNSVGFISVATAGTAVIIFADDDLLDPTGDYQIVRRHVEYHADEFTWVDFDDETLHSTPAKKLEFDEYVYLKGWEKQITSSEMFSKIVRAKQTELLETKHFPDNIKAKFRPGERSYAALCTALCLSAKPEVVRYDDVLNDVHEAVFFLHEDAFVQKVLTQRRSRYYGRYKVPDLLRKARRYTCEAGDKKAKLLSALLLRRDDLGLILLRFFRFSQFFRRIRIFFKRNLQIGSRQILGIR